MSIRITPLTDPDRGPSSLRPGMAGVRRRRHPRRIGVPAPVHPSRPGTPGRTGHSTSIRPSGAAESAPGSSTTVVAAARDDGRRCVLAQTEAGSPGAHFLSARGFRKVLTLTFARLPLTDADVAALGEIISRPHPGYRLASWHGTVPDSLAQTFAASRRAMDDMPMDDSGHGTVAWDVDRVRAAARAVEDRGDLLHTVVAVDESDGSIAGFTELVVPGSGKGDGQHYGTGVLPEHRGHGLGRWMKAASIRQARERHPELGGLLTDTADSNRHMRNINDALGYEPTHKALDYQLDL